MLIQVFKQTPSDANSYLTDPEFGAKIESQQNTKLETLSRVQAALVDQFSYDFDDCIRFAR